MAEAGTPAGRLIVVDGSRGRDVIEAAEALAAGLRARGLACGISRWDASGLFNELALAGREERAISLRTITLAYVADLAFRLRWEIQPTLASGGVVIAAPYVETAVAFGVACGLPAQWLRDVLRLAPVPTERALTRERKRGRGWKARLDRGYPEYGATLAAAADPKFDDAATRKAMIASLEKGQTRRIWTLTKVGLVEAADAIAGTRPDAAPRSARRPRSNRR